MVWAILPLKDLVKAKSRLAGILAPHERRALVQAMAEDVLTILAGHPGLRGVLLVSDDPSAEMLACKYALDWVAETQLGCSGLNGAVGAATDYLAARGAQRVMVLHGDIPLLQTEDVTALLALFERPDVDLVIGPDLAGTGTNVMLFPVAKRPHFYYGDNSCDKHQRAGRALGHAVSLLQSTGIGLDVDTPADLLLLRERLRAGALAPNSAALLLDTSIGRRLAALERAGLGREPEGRTHDAI
jgi:2-phospho-L-lactate guanylyltransferase